MNTKTSRSVVLVDPLFRGKLRSRVKATRLMTDPRMKWYVRAEYFAPVDAHISTSGIRHDPAGFVPE
ncbi:MAG TPA: hypothetical protein VGK55_01860 [Actinomycetes bacterium]